MFGRQRPITFDPYAGRRRSRRGLPSWAVWLLAGLAAGVGGVLFVQERYLPPRLSPEASTRLQQAYDAADADRRRLARELAASQDALKQAQAARQTAEQALAAGREQAERFDADLAFAVDALPSDPRPGQISVRAAQFEVAQGLLHYSAALSRDGREAPLPVTLQVVVSGQTAQGDVRSVALQPVKLSLGKQAVVRGQLPLPEGLRPRLATIKLLGTGANAPQLGMRVLRVD
jgi:hypothetical protein